MTAAYCSPILYLRNKIIALCYCTVYGKVVLLFGKDTNDDIGGIVVVGRESLDVH